MNWQALIGEGLKANAANLLERGALLQLPIWQFSYPLYRIISRYFLQNQQRQDQSLQPANKNQSAQGYCWVYREIVLHRKYPLHRKYHNHRYQFSSFGGNTGITAKKAIETRSSTTAVSIIFCPREYGQYRKGKNKFKKAMKEISITFSVS